MTQRKESKKKKTMKKNIYMYANVTEKYLDEILYIIHKLLRLRMVIVIFNVKKKYFFYYFSHQEKHHDDEMILK